MMERYVYDKEFGITDTKTGVCPFCGTVTRYDSRAGRMPLACGKGACKSKARKQGRRPLAWKQSIKNGVVNGRS